MENKKYYIELTCKDANHSNLMLKYVKLIKDSTGMGLKEAKDAYDAVRAGQKITNTSRHVDSLIKFINDKYQKEIDKRSTPAGKSTQQKKRDDILSFFSKSNKANLKLVFDLQNAIVDGKLKIINKLDKLSNMNTFIKTKNGFKVTGSEGYVAIDKLKGGAFKLVDRLEFSYNNFSPDVIKGWDTPSRS